MACVGSSHPEQGPLPPVSAPQLPTRCPSESKAQGPESGTHTAASSSAQDSLRCGRSTPPSFTSQGGNAVRGKRPEPGPDKEPHAAPCPLYNTRSEESQAAEGSRGKTRFHISSMRCPPAPPSPTPSRGTTKGSSGLTWGHTACSQESHGMPLPGGHRAGRGMPGRGLSVRVPRERATAASPCSP